MKLEFDKTWNYYRVVVKIWIRLGAIERVSIARAEKDDFKSPRLHLARQNVREKNSKFITLSSDSSYTLNRMCPIWIAPTFLHVDCVLVTKTFDLY